MTTPFENGRTYRHPLSLKPPKDKKIPFVSVYMAADNKMDFNRVVGKVDTGASRTLLTLNTAKALGIEDPIDPSARKDTYTMANGQKFVCQTHMVYVDLLTMPKFLVYAGVSDSLVNNLFGNDWLQYLCIAVDSQKVHFLYG